MNAPSKRMLAIAKQISPQGRKQKSTLSLVYQTSPSWICEQCSNRNCSFIALKEAANPLRKSTAFPIRPRTVRLRALSSSCRRRDSANSRDDLPSKEEGRRSPTSKRFDHLMDNIQANIFTASQRLNDLTGYSGIEALKKEIEQQGSFISSCT